MILSVTIGCGGQDTGGMRAQAQAEADTALRANRAAAATFLDRSKPADARIAAAQNVATLLDRGDTAAALEIVRNEEEPVAVRARALEIAWPGISRDDEILTDILALLVAKDTPLPLRRSVARTLQLLLVGGSAPGARREDILAALRAVAQDDDVEVRTTALGTLAGEGDGVAQAILTEDLRDPGKQLMAPEEAVALLALHPDGDTLPVLREMLAKPPNPAAQEEAVRALGADVQSHDALQSVIRSNESPDTLRFAAVGALNANAPEKIAGAALPLLNDEGAGDDVRIYAIKAVQTYQEAQASILEGPAAAPTAEEKAFANAVKKLQAKTKSAAVREAAKEYSAKKP